MKLTPKQKEQLKNLGISKKELQMQLRIFEEGIPFVQLKENAGVKNGIVKLKRDEQQHYVRLFESKQDSLDLLKFTPASGAATRMFKFLFEFLNDYKAKKESINAYINKNNAQAVRLFFVGLDGFPFYTEVRKQMVAAYKGKSFTNVDKNRIRFAKTLLTNKGLNFGNAPKGLIPFHRYKSHQASAFEEHLYEAAAYTKSKKKARLHFTISPDHEDAFKDEFNAIKTRIEEETETVFEISYSFQEKSTDTIAVDENNHPYLDSAGTFYFRPGGHGALINNLNQQDADIIFIKNIDNVVTRQFENKIAFYKKMLAGKLIELQSTLFSFAQQLDEESPNIELITRISHFLKQELHLTMSHDFEKFAIENQFNYLKNIVNRPLRVCGMVINEGEPGGGPFWVRQENGQVSLQIVEGSQVNTANEQQHRIFKEATHFNPVDIVCGIKNYKGEKYDLLKYVNSKAGFISSKTIKGTPIKALEHPGLWNGAMAYWNTIFVEVPLITFNPVKTVNDLLKTPHQVAASD